MLKKYIAPLLLILPLCSKRAQGQVAIIPVVFHVVYATTPENVPDSCLHDQIEVWNEDFNAQNADLWKVPAAWQPIIGNLDVQFVIASTDPQGNPTTGVERRNYPTSSWAPWDNDIKFFATGGLNAWPYTQYLNVWVCDVGGILGWAQPPYTGSGNTDGIVMDYQVIGRGTYASPPYDHGRVGTHVLGNWLGLFDLLDDNSCADTDTISDTPPYMLSNVIGSYAPGTVLTDACNPNPPGIMWMNFMTHVADTSMYFFTQGQVNAMSSILHTVHSSFLTGVGIAEHETSAQLDVAPNPSNDGLFSLTRKNSSARAEIIAYNMLGELIAQPVPLEAGESTASLDLSGLPGGVYIVALRDGTSFVSRRVIIAK